MVDAESHSWRQGLNKDEVDALAACEKRFKLEPGQYLYHYGDPADSSYHIVSGSIEISTLTEDGRRHLLAKGEPGLCVGDLALVGLKIRITDAIAVEKTTVAALSRTDFERLCYKYPGISLSMNRVMGRHFQVLFSYIRDASLLPLYQRLGRNIVRLSLTQGRLRQDGSMVIEDCSQEMLGDMVGAVRQSVGRELKKMADKGLITIDYRSIKIHDFQRMTAEFSQTLDYEPVTLDLLKGYN